MSLPIRLMNLSRKSAMWFFTVRGETSSFYSVRQWSHRDFSQSPNMFSGQFQVGFKKIQELLLLFDFEPSILLEIDNDAIGNRPLAAGSENLAFREHYEIVPKEKLEVVNDNLLDLFFSIELGKISSKYLPFFVQFRHFSSKLFIISQ